MNQIKKNHEAMLRTGTMALAAAGASTAAHAATVQITFNNSFISSTSGNQLDTDFGGDGQSDIANVRVLPAQVGLVGEWSNRYSRVRYVVDAARVNYISGGVGVFALVGAHLNRQNGPGGVVSLDGLVSLTFSDSRVRGGAAVTGLLDVTATARGSGEFARIDVHRVIFDDASGVAPSGVSHSDAAYPEYGAAVPEPSGLGLLALGAGGLLARRRRAMAA